MAIGRAEQVVLLDQATRAIDEGVAERVSNRRRDARQQRSAVLMVPAFGEVEP